MYAFYKLVAMLLCLFGTIYLFTRDSVHYGSRSCCAQATELQEESNTLLSVDQDAQAHESEDVETSQNTER